MTTEWGLSTVKAIVVGAGMAAFLDLTEAMLFYGLKGVALIKIPQSIASGILGRSAYFGGTRTALLGFALHCFIAAVWAVIFVLAARTFGTLRHNAVSSGAVYGVLIYVIMYFLVLPRSNVYPQPHLHLLICLNNVASMVFCVGIPISLANSYLVPGNARQSF